MVIHQLIRGDVRRGIPLPDGSVHCVVTSPPYFSLRDYGTGRWEGGAEGCDHQPNHREYGERMSSGLSGGFGVISIQELGRNAYRDTCGKCGARRVDRQLGLEATPSEYVDAMVGVFREIRRVLHPSGTLWCNMGDSYNSSPSNQQGRQGTTSGLVSPKYAIEGMAGQGRQHRAMAGLKPKDLCGIPWRLGFALQADGWWLRSEIIWAKPNAMPESVTDRPTKSHEQVFLFAKNATYYYDAEAVREPALNTGNGVGWSRRGDAARDAGSRTDLPDPKWDGKPEWSGRNLRSVWTIPSEAYTGAHFATFPRKLVEPCIKAGTSERGACPRCGAMWERVVEREADNTGYPNGPGGQKRHQGLVRGSAGTLATIARYKSETIGWQPSCRCGLEPQPCLILDPFCGSGTTLVVADALGRRGIGIDLSAEYLSLATRRITRPHAPVPRSGPDDDLPLFAMQRDDSLQHADA